MRYFNGFSLRGEEQLFEEILPGTETTVAGFSYGAQQALEYALHSSCRIDRLILISPAFFHNQKESFIRAQLRYFESDKDAYIQTFLKNVAYPSDRDLTSYLHPGNKESLEALLNYQWKAEDLHTLQQKGIQVEVFLGAEDRIIDAEVAYAFFSELTTTYLIKKAGHLLAS